MAADRYSPGRAGSRPDNHQRCRRPRNRPAGVPDRLAIFAAAGQVLLAQPIPGLIRFDRACFAIPADVMRLLAWLQRRPPYVAVVTDRTGADITAIPAGALDGSTSAIAGPDDEIERNAPGGWSQSRYQRRAEDSWQHNARAVAAAVTRAPEAGPRPTAAGRRRCPGRPAAAR